MDNRFMSLVSEECEDMLEDIGGEVREEHFFSDDHSMYPYIPLSHFYFKDLVGKHLHRGMRVIDVGCGAGDKLLAFNKLCAGLSITGLEYNPAMAAFAQYIAPFATVLDGNAFDMDYQIFDLVYMYRPLPDEFSQARLQNHVMDTMKSGAVLCISYSATSNFRDNCNFPDFHAGWRKP